MRPSFEQVNRILTYEPKTGVLTRRITTSTNAKKGSTAGTTLDRYVRISVLNRLWYGHRLAWLLTTGKWPAREIDHINGNGLDNRWSNLREATHQQNCSSLKRCKRNSSGYKGVSWDNFRGKWKAQISRNGKNSFVGRFSTREEAHAAYVKAAKKYFGEFARAA